MSLIRIIERVRCYRLNAVITSWDCMPDDPYNDRSSLRTAIHP